MNLLGKTEEKNISIIKDPFKSDKIYSISFNLFNYGDVYWSARVEFRNGNTSGEQRFKVDGAENFSIIVKQVEDFLSSLK